MSDASGDSLFDPAESLREDRRPPDSAQRPQTEIHVNCDDSAARDQILREWRKAASAKIPDNPLNRPDLYVDVSVRYTPGVWLFRRLTEFCGRPRAKGWIRISTSLGQVWDARFEVSPYFCGGGFSITGDQTYRNEVCRRIVMRIVDELVDRLELSRKTSRRIRYELYKTIYFLEIAIAVVVLATGCMLGEILWKF